MSSSGSSIGPKRAPGIRLGGPSPRLDARVHAVRADLADVALAGRVVAPRYASPVAMRCRVVAAPLFGRPDAETACITELLYGEDFAVFDRNGAWAWGQCDADGYVGWICAEALAIPAEPVVTMVTAAQALLFAAASIKAPVVLTIPLGARLACVPHDANFVAHGATFLHRRHLAALVGDPVDLAGDFLGTPYRWGGRTRAGLDCSGLTQAVLRAHGIACPRDSDQQLAAFPAVPFADRRRGDLVGFPGHIGILVDRDRLLHANAHHMSTVVEPLVDIVARLQPLHPQPVIGVVRPL